MVGAVPTSTAADLLDGVLAPPGGVNLATKSGYNFTYAISATVGYTVNAAPVTANQTGVRNFYTDASGVIRANAAGAATLTSTPL